MSQLLAGAASVSIGPRAEDLREGVYLGGFGSYRQRRATGVHDEPCCRALAISDGETTAVLAALDLVGASGPLLASIRSEAAKLTGLPATQVIISCTHSHASPDMQGLWGGTGARYQTHVAQQSASAIGQAFDALVPASVRAATTTLGRVVRNRRGWSETDETLTMLRVLGVDQTPIATLLNYACHPTASGPANTEVSRDWCGYAVDAVEEALGGVAIYVNGAIGDVNPAADGGFEHARSLGEAVATCAIASLAAADDLDGPLVVRTEPLLLPMNFERLSGRVHDAVARAGPALSVLSKTGGMRTASVALHAAARPDLAQLVAAFAGTAERNIAHHEGGAYLPTHCGYLQLGSQVEAFAAPGEVLTRLGLPLRASLTAPHRLFLGLTHDTLGYFVPEDEWMTGHNNNYEESVSYGKHAGTVVAEALLALVPHAEQTPA